MKLGAQLFSLRGQMQTPAEIRAGFVRLAQMGYQCVQVSGIGPMEPQAFRALSEETSLPIVLTHVPLERIVEDTDRLIAEHREMGCPVIGLGAMPAESRADAAAADAFLTRMQKPVDKILAAGLRFAYHNHHFEFVLRDAEGRPYFDRMLEKCPDWQFVLDTYWVAYAGYDPAEYIRRAGPGRLTNVHFKDMVTDESRAMCPCGSGRIDFGALMPLCREAGVENALVEQDNATDKADPFGEMENSFRGLAPLFGLAE